jgi:aminoglycoside phosphotransferase (APT) family kinase protein
MTALPGRVEWVPESVEPWLARMAEVLPLIHAADLAEAGRFPQHVPDTPSSFAPPHWTHRPDLWERAAEIYHEAAPEEARVFVHGDFHPGNLLWNENVMTGVIDWQAASIGLKSVDVANCRGNLFPYGLDMADRFTSYWEHLTGERFNPWAGLVGCVGYLDGMRDDRPTDWLVIEEALAREVAELSGP